MVDASWLAHCDWRIVADASRVNFLTDGTASMAGGLFPGYPFVPNWKCVVFTALIAGGYWYLPPKHGAVLFALLILPYVAMAWYDYMYDCKNKLKPTLVPFGRTLFLPLKPPEYQAEFQSLPPEAIRAMDSLDHVSAWILVVIATYYLVR